MVASLSPRGTAVVSVAGVVLVSAYAGSTAWAAARAPYDAWIALVVIPLLVLVTVPMLVRGGRRDPDPRFLGLLVCAFVLKMAATVARYLMAFVLYDGSADAALYDIEGTRLASEYRDGNLTAEIGRDFIGTGFVRVFTGFVYAITGPSIYIGYAVYSWLGFWGLYFLYRAFRISIPDGDARRYAVLVLFLPSMLFWPSGLGKEAFMTFAIGLVAWGTARLLSGYRGWLTPLAVGILATAVVRPHITAALFAGVGVAYLARRQPGPMTELSPLRLGLAALAVAGGAWVAVAHTASFLGVQEVTVSNVDAAIADTGNQTNTGGSAYEATGVEHLSDLPLATFSVLFRPLLFEAGNAQMLLAAAEGTLLLGMVVWSWRSLVTVRGRLRRQPYLIFAVVYALIFVYAFSNFSNFGLLTRERVQVLPFVLVFLALRAPRPLVEPSPSVPPTREGART